MILARIFVLTVFPFVYLLSMATASAETPSQDLPNIVVFISDDLGRLDTSVYGSEEIRTPNMERLSRLGMTFDNAYVASPACCPNRNSLLTGLMPARHGAHPNHSQVTTGTQFLLPVLQSMGYHVASFGKIGHGKKRHSGCDHFSANPRNMTKTATEFFNRKPIESPVCLLIGDRRPHVPWAQESIYDASTITLPEYLLDTPETRDHWARYMTDITQMDQELGQAIDFAEQKFGDNFIFMFTSDHGGQWPFGKWNLYDSGTRVPLIITWQRKIESGKRTNAMVSWVDLIPTLIDLVGGKVVTGIDGISFSDVLLGKSETHRSKIFTTQTGDGVMNIYPMRSVRMGRYKLIHNLCPDALHTNHSDRLQKDGAGAFWNSWDEMAKNNEMAAELIQRYHQRPEFELFDLNADPTELNNLADVREHGNRLNKLQSELDRWMNLQNDDGLPHRDPHLIKDGLPDLQSAKKSPSKK